MNDLYYQAIDKMEKANVSRDYLVGWASGFLKNPKLEEQRITEAYEAGYAAGEEQSTDKFQEWVNK